MNRPAEEKLPLPLLVALKDCHGYAKHRPYIWKPKSMEKLAVLGYVEPEMLMHAGRTVYRVTEKGRAFLEKTT